MKQKCNYNSQRKEYTYNFIVDKLGRWIRTIHIGEERRHATIFTKIPRQSEKQDVTNY